MGAEFIEVEKAAGPTLNPSAPDVSYNTAYQRLYALAETYMELYRKVSWVRSCVDIIADSSTAEPYVIKTVGQQQELDDQTENPRVKALQTVLDGINPDYDAMELMNKNVGAMKINGTSYNRVLRKAGGRQMVGLEYIAFTRVKPNVDDQGNVTSWSVKSKRGSTTETVPARDIVVFKLPHPVDDIIGLSPLESLDLPTAVDIQAQRFNEAAFRNGPYASMVISMKNADDTEIKRNREYIKNNFTKPENAHKPMILEGEVEIIGDSLMRRSVDGSFIELRKFNREEICSVYRVPTTKILSEDNRSNTEQHDEGFIRDTIEPIQRLYWNQFNRRILQQEFGIYDMIVTAGKKQDVNMSNVNIATKMVQAGATGNEARKVMSLNSIDGYDVPMFAKLVTPEDNAESAAKSKVDVTPTKVAPQNVKKASADDVEQTDTSQDEQEFMAAWIALMASMRKRSQSTVSLNDLYRAWLPTAADVQSLAESLAELYRQVWLESYNRRRVELGEPPLTELPPDVAERLALQAAQTANGILETYQNELSDHLTQAQSDLRNLVGDKLKSAVESNVISWMKERAIRKAKEIAVTEAGRAWNDGLFTHDRKYAPETQYTVLPKDTEHEACAEIIDGAPYTLDSIPAQLPLHPHCPHRYYAIASKEVSVA